MNKKDTEALDHFLSAYKSQWDLNQYYRDQYDDDYNHYICQREDTGSPLAYNLSFPQLLPRIITMLSKMLEQLYQGGTGGLVSVRARKAADADRTQRVQGLLNYQLENLNSIDMQGGSYLFNLQWMTNALSWGKGIAKVYWRKEERISPRRVYIPTPQFDKSGRLVGIGAQSVVTEEPQIVYDGPYAEVIHNKCFVPHPLYKNIQKMPFVFCVYSKSVDYLRKMEQKGVYRNLKDLGGSGGAVLNGMTEGKDSSEAFVRSIELETDFYGADYQSDRIAPNVDIVEGYGKYIFPEDEVPYEIGSGMKIKGAESEAIVHIGNYQTLLGIQKNTYGFRPFFDIGAYRHPELYWDMGLIKLGKDLETQYETLANTRYQNALMSVNQMLQVREDADISPEALIWKPFGIVPVSEINADVAPLATADMTQSNAFREQEDFFKSTIEDITGMYRYGMGSTPSRRENVGTIYSLQSVGETRTKLLMMTMDHQGFQPLLKYMMLLNTWHLPDDFESRINTPQGEQFSPMFPGDIHPDYDFTARYTSMEPALGKQFKAQQLIQYAQMWQGSPYLQQRQFMQAIMEMMDFPNTDKFVKTEQQLMKEQFATAQRETERVTQESLMQDKLHERKTGREMQRDVIKGLLK